MVQISVLFWGHVHGLLKFPGQGSNPRRVLLDTPFFLYENGLVTANFSMKAINFFFFLFSRAALRAYGGSQARGLIGAVATGLYQSHSNEGSEPCLQPTLQLMATPDP